MKWGRTDRPRSTTGRPGERRSETRALRRQRPGKLREGEPARAQGALRPGCPRGRSERRSNRCECVLRGDRWESKAQSFRSDPWAAVRRARLDPMQPVPDSGDGNPPGFSARNAGKARNCLNYRPNNRANGRLRRGFWANSTRITRAELAPISLRGSSSRKPAPEPSPGPTSATATG